MKKLISILLSIICIIGLSGCGSKKSEALAASPSNQSAEQNQNKNKIALDPLNAAYKIDDNLIKLVNGKSEMEAAPGSASKIVTTVWKQPVVDDLNGDKAPDAALILTQETGGSGTFYYIAADLSTKDGRYTGTNGIFLGDRIKPQSIKIENRHIIVTYLDRKENEPMSAAPSVRKTKTFLVTDTSLTEK